MVTAGKDEDLIQLLYEVRGAAAMLKDLGDDIRSVIDLARNELGLDVVERSIDRTETFICEEMFMTGTAAGITAVTNIDHRPVGAGTMGTVTTKLRSLYDDILHGRNKKYEHWNVVAL